MNASRAACPLACPTQAELDALMHAGIDIMAVATPRPMLIACGDGAPDGYFDPDHSGERWLAFEEPEADDIVFWHWSSGRMCSWSGRVFALGGAIIDEPATYSFDCALNIFSDPIDWLIGRRDGIVVLPDRWHLAFDRLRDCPRIAVAESILPLYRHQMKPTRLPEIFVLRPQRRSAA